MGYVMRSLLLILLFSIVNSQARVLREESEKVKGNYGKTPTLPPPAPRSSTPIEELAPLLIIIGSLNNYGRPRIPSPPPPKPSNQVIQMVIPSRTTRPPPPAPKLPPPSHQVTGGGTNLFLAA